MLNVMALVTLFVNKIVGNFFNSLVTDAINHTAQDTSTRMVRL